MLRWLYFVWALLATTVMLLATPRLLGFGSDAYGDAAILFWSASLFGLPGWLNVAALTIVRWPHIPSRVKLLQNRPAILSGLLYAIVSIESAL